jgi:type II secretory pathway component GspD/PulD (secretin)
MFFSFFSSNLRKAPRYFWLSLVVAFVLVGLGGTALGQSSKEVSTNSGEPAAIKGDLSEKIQLSLRGQTELRTLVQFVSSTLGINIHYDSGIAKKQVTVLSPAKIPKDSLLGLLQSILKMSDLALVDSDQPGWKKIVPIKDASEAAVIVEDPSKLPSLKIVAQMFEVKHVAVDSVSKTIEPFLDKKSGANSYPIPGRRLLVVTDYAGNLGRIAKIIEMVDRPDAGARVQMIAVKNADAGELSKKVSELLRQKAQADPQKDKKAEMIVNFDAPSNRIILICPGPADPDILELIEKLDVPSQLVTKKHLLRHVSPQRVERILKQMVEARKAGGEYKSAIDEESGLWVVSALPWVHEQIDSIREQIDRPEATEEIGHLRFYKLKNTTASEVLSTIRAIDSGQTIQAVSNRRDGEEQESATRTTPTEVNPSIAPPANPNRLHRATARTKDAVVTADPNTNTIIVVAPTAVQKVYEKLIHMLDKRRPQVMIEVTLVTLDTSDGFSLGVEISQRRALSTSSAGDETSSYLSFSAFGLSEVDLTTGMPTITPGVGFNGVLLDQNTVNVVLRALASDTHSKVLSAPKVLVNDNATATLQSVAEFPYASLNASDTVSTTSFGGYTEAGTTINVTPHISEDDYLQLLYAVTLNSFGEQSDSSLPPPRQTDTLNSEITIPDGHAIVVGGLTRKSESETVSKLPWLGDIPILKYLVSNRSDNNSQSTLFVFIRPVILRDDQFEDLKYLSEKDLAAAELPSNYPASRPVIME